MSCDSPHRLVQVEMIVVQEGEEPNDFCALVGDMNCYYSLVKGIAHIAHEHTSLHTTHTLHLTYKQHTPHTLTTHTHTTHTPCTHTRHTHAHTTHTHTHLTPFTPTSDVRLHDYISHLFELNSTTGEFVASEVLYPAMTPCRLFPSSIQTSNLSCSQVQSHSS